ncbi:MAG: hypothetical protein HY819_07460 [Acidobacteria bacterium]|nr:hypothetical protein [Acidobacteriota bacterium]
MTEQNKPIKKEDLSAQLAILWATSQFFTSLQNIMLEKEMTSDLGLAQVQGQIEKLPTDISPENELVEKIKLSLEDAQVQLLLVDSRISVSVMRRFFERIGEADSSSLKHIIQYYFSKPIKDESDRDKIDLLVTRFCSEVTNSINNIKQRQVKDNVQAILLEICGTQLTSSLEFVQTAVVSRLRQLCRVITDARSFNNLIEGKLISQLRDYKISLGDMFFAPAVLEEIIRMNIAVHNKFQELYFSEQARLRMETARMLHNLQTGRHLIAKDLQNPLVGQLNNLILQMQQYIQDLRRNLADQIIKDRSLRTSIEADGNTFTLVINSLEESLLRSKNLLTKLQEVYIRVGSSKQEPLQIETRADFFNSGIRKIDFTSPEILEKARVSSTTLEIPNIEQENKVNQPINNASLSFTTSDQVEKTNSTKITESDEKDLSQSQNKISPLSITGSDGKQSGQKEPLS